MGFYFLSAFCWFQFSTYGWPGRHSVHRLNPEGIPSIPVYTTLFSATRSLAVKKGLSLCLMYTQFQNLQQMTKFFTLTLILAKFRARFRVKKHFQAAWKLFRLILVGAQLEALEMKESYQREVIEIFLRKDLNKSFHQIWRMRSSSDLQKG